MSKIPERATHTAPDGTYRMARGSLWYGYADGDWVYIEGAAPHCYTKIQAEPEWSGEGLPPVGLECEWHSDSQTGWQVVKVLAYHGQDAWIKVKGKCPTTVGNPANFRHMRTADQIEEDERALFLSRAREIYTQGASGHKGGIMALYDAGLRFVEVKK